MFDSYYLKVAKRVTSLSCKVQAILQYFGIAIHNPFRDECCIDFECCSPYSKRDKKHKNRCWLHISSKMLPIRRKTWYEPTAPIGTPGRTFIKKSKLIFFNKE